jgi:membrane protease YdiL (CAAX protease family)
MTSLSSDRLSRAKLLAMCALFALAIETTLQPLSQLLAQVEFLPSPIRGHFSLGLHELILLGLAIALLVGKGDWPLILAPRPGSEFRRGVLLAMPFLAPIAIAAVLLSPVQVPGRSGFWIVILVFAGTALLVALAEEFLLRGLVQQWLELRLSPRSIVWLQAILFVALHSIDRPVNLFTILYYFLGGAVLTLLIFRWRTVWVPVGVHFAWDSVAFSLEGVPLRGKQIAGFFAEPSPPLLGILFIFALTVAFVFLSQSPIVGAALERRRFQPTA